ncbi:MAG: serine protease [Nostocales cyanobacterium]|nr:MAG: serine protease [Nostocales cyanobacterium]TAF21608.1 MAG: serine protease [Nostocales cyanobacterium]
MTHLFKKITCTALTTVTLTVAASAHLNSPVIAQNRGSTADILNAHNKYRKEVGVPPLTWSNTLANNAQQWANYLASQGGNLQHSQNTGQGENLWAGTAGYFSYTQMVDSWGSEKQYFVNGTFPNVSSTGNWYDVGHYTQIIWRKTTQVGCGIARGGGNDILVCRYSPPGNYMGQKVY